MCSGLVPLTDLGYNLRDSWWGVPLIPELAVVAIELRQLGEVNVSAETFFDRLSIENVSIGRKLDSFCQSRVQVADEKLGVEATTLSHAEGRNEFAVRVQRDKNPSVTKLSRIVFSDMLRLLCDKGPDFIALQAFARELAHPRIQEFFAALPGFHKQTHDGVSIQTCEPFRAANRATLKKALYRVKSGIRPTSHRGASQPDVRFAESGFAGSADQGTKWGMPYLRRCGSLSLSRRGNRLRCASPVQSGLSLAAEVATQCMLIYGLSVTSH
jgi:hypothetical protein